MTQELTITQGGSPSFPIFIVYRDTIDAEGYTVEHLSEEVARFSTMAQAEQFIKGAK